jgi:hypothetical protein
VPAYPPDTGREVYRAGSVKPQVTAPNAARVALARPGTAWTVRPAHTSTSPARPWRAGLQEPRHGVLVWLLPRVEVGSAVGGFTHDPHAGTPGR